MVSRNRMLAFANSKMPACRQAGVSSCESARGEKTLRTGKVLLSQNAPSGCVEKPGGRKKQVQARGKTPRSQSLFFTAFALLAQLIGFFNSPPVPVFFLTFAHLRFVETMPRKQITSFSTAPSPRFFSQPGAFISCIIVQTRRSFTTQIFIKPFKIDFRSRR